MRAKAIAAVVAATAIAGLLLPVGAAAQTKTASGNRHHPTVAASMAFKGTNGYLVGVTLVNRTKLKISASPEGGLLSGSGLGFVSTEYTLDAPQPSGSNGIKASLGKFGRIEVRFIPQSEAEVAALLPVCKGEKYRVLVGEFVGLIAFRGEHGYTRVRRKRAFGTVGIAPAPTCQKSIGRKPQVRSPHQRARAALITTARRAAKPESHLLGLGASALGGNQKVGFAALRLSVRHKRKEFAFDTFVAVATRDLGRIHEYASAGELLARGPFFKVPDLTHPTVEAVLAPPKPFLGSATFSRESADEVSWKGDLRVKLPGFGVVPLTGPTFKSVMCADSGCHLTE